MAQAYVSGGNTLENLTSQLPEEAIAYYKSLSEDQRNRINRIIVGRSKNLGSPYYQYYYELTESDYYRSWRLAISAYLSTHDANESSPAAKAFYQSQSPQDQSKIESILASPLKSVSAGALAHYANLDSDNKKSVAQLLGKYISGGGNLDAANLTAEQQAFYQNLGSADKTKVDEILASTFKNLSSEEKSYFEKLDSEQKGHIGLLAQSYFLNHVGILSFKVGAKEIAFYQGLKPEERKIVDNFQAGQMTDMSPQEQKFIGQLSSGERETMASLVGVSVLSDGNLVPDYLSKEDHHFYQNLSQEEKGIMGSLASSSLSGLSSTDAQFINDLSDQEKASLGKLTKAHIEIAIAVDASAQAEEEFDSPEVARIDELISLMVAARLYAVELAFTEDQLQFYNSLTSGDKDRIERTVRSRVRVLSSSGLTAMREEDELFYNNLPEDDRNKVDGIITTVLEDNGLTLAMSMESGQKEFYQNLSPEDKARTDRLIAYSLAKDQNSELRRDNSASARFYRNLPPEDQRRINRYAQAYISGTEGFSELAHSSADETHYQALSEDDKNLTREAVRDRVLDLSSSVAFTIEDRDQQFYASLADGQKEVIDELATAFIINDPEYLGRLVNSVAKEFRKNLSESESKQVDRLVVTRISNLT